MKTNVIVCLVSFIVGGATIAALDRLYLKAPDRFEFRQMKRGTVEVMYRVNKTTGDVQYVTSSADPEKISGPTPKGNGEWWKSAPLATPSAWEQFPRATANGSGWPERAIPVTSATAK